MSVQVTPLFIARPGECRGKGISRFKRATPTRNMKRRIHNKRTNILTLIHNIK